MCPSVTKIPQKPHGNVTPKCPRFNRLMLGQGAPNKPIEQELRRVEMVVRNQGGTRNNSSGGSEQSGKLAWFRLAGQLSNGRARSGESVKVSEIAEKYKMDEGSVLKILKEFQVLGMATLSG